MANSTCSFSPNKHLFSNVCVFSPSFSFPWVWSQWNEYAVGCLDLYLFEVLTHTFVPHYPVQKEEATPPPTSLFPLAMTLWGLVTIVLRCPALGARYSIHSTLDSHCRNKPRLYGIYSFYWTPRTFQSKDPQDTAWGGKFLYFFSRPGFVFFMIPDFSLPQHSVLSLLP